MEFCVPPTGARLVVVYHRTYLDKWRHKLKNSSAEEMHDYAHFSTTVLCCSWAGWLNKGSGIWNNMTVTGSINSLLCRSISHYYQPSLCCRGNITVRTIQLHKRPSTSHECGTVTSIRFSSWIAESTANRNWKLIDEDGVELTD
jgi:hypothetical protein